MNKQKKRRERLRYIEENLIEHQLPDEVKESAERVLSEEAHQALVENRIQQAITDGVFENLPGAGKPLDLKKNPYLDPAQELAFDLLQNNQLAPEWIERDKAIRREREAMRHRLQVAWQEYQTAPAQSAVWQAAVARFEIDLQKLNRKIDDFNLIVPILSCQRPRLRLADELQCIQNDVG